MRLVEKHVYALLRWMDLSKIHGRVFFFVILILKEITGDIFIWNLHANSIFFLPIDLVYNIFELQLSFIFSYGLI